MTDESIYSLPDGSGSPRATAVEAKTALIPMTLMVDGVPTTTVAGTGDSLIAGRNTMSLPAAALTPRGTNGCAALAVSAGASDQPDVPYLAFDGAAKEYAGFVVAMPKSWDGGAVRAAFKWRRASGTGAANVVWGLRALSVGDDESPAANFGSDATVTDAAHTTAANFKLGGETGDCTIGGTPAGGELVFFEVFRDGASGSDTLNSIDAWLSVVHIFYNTDKASDD